MANRMHDRRNYQGGFSRRHFNPPLISNRDINPAAETLLGYAMQEVYGQPIGNVLISAENLVPALQSALQSIATPNLQCALHRRDGSTFPAHAGIRH
jgi:hypothetical protein